MEGRDSQVLDAVLLPQRDEPFQRLPVLLDVADLDAELGPRAPKLLQESKGPRAVWTALAREHLDVRPRRLGGSRGQDDEHHEGGDDRSHDPGGRSRVTRRGPAS